MCSTLVVLTSGAIVLCFAPSWGWPRWIVAIVAILVLAVSAVWAFYPDDGPEDDDAE